MPFCYIGLVTASGEWHDPATDDGDHTGHVVFSNEINRALIDGGPPLDTVLSPEERALLLAPHHPDDGNHPFNVLDPVKLRQALVRVYEHLGRHDEEAFLRWQGDLAMAAMVCTVAAERGWLVEYHRNR